MRIANQLDHLSLSDDKNCKDVISKLEALKTHMNENITKNLSILETSLSLLLSNRHDLGLQLMGKLELGLGD